MKICPACATKYPDDANFCPMDAKRLVPDAPPVATAPPTAQAAPAKAAGAPPDRTISDGEGAIGGRFLPRPGPRSSTPLGPLVPATDAQSGGEVVVQLVDLRALPSTTLAERVIRELKQLAKARSERFLRVVDQGRLSDGRVFVASEEPGGETLEALVSREGPLPLDRAKSIVLAVGEALVEAQKVGVIHRDLSPRNVHVGAQVKLGGFALAEPVSDKVFGAPGFLSPEQAEGKPVDQRSNIYSLGALLYYMVVGEPPFAGEPLAMVQQHLHAQPSAPGGKRPGLPPELDRLVAKALEKSGGRRHLTLRQLLSEVEALPATAALERDAHAAAEAHPRPAERPTVMGLVTTPTEPPPPAVGTPIEAGLVQPVTLPQSAPPVAEDGARTVIDLKPPAIAAQPPLDEPVAASRAGSQAIASDSHSTPLPQPAPAAAIPQAIAPASEPSIPVPLDRPIAKEPGPVAAPSVAATPSASVAAPASAAPSSVAPPPAVAVAPKPNATAPTPAAAPPGNASGPVRKSQTAKTVVSQKAMPVAGAKRKGFRETAWFKRGEVEQELAAKAAELAASDPLAGPASTEAVVDESTLTAEDRARLSLKTGRTEMMAPIRVSKLPGEQMSEQDMLAEMDGSRKWLFVSGGAMAVLAIIAAVYFLFLNK